MTKYFQPLNEQINLLNSVIMPYRKQLILQFIERMVIPLYKVTVYCNDALYPDSHWRKISESFYNNIGELFDTYGYVLGNNPVKFSSIAELKYGESKSVYCSGVRYDIKKIERYDI